MKNRTGELREDWTLIMSRCYSQELSACPKHPIFQPQKAINLLLKACKEKGLAFVVDRELQWPEYFAGEWYCDDKGNKIIIDDVVRRAGYKPVEEIDIEENTD